MLFEVLVGEVLGVVDDVKLVDVDEGGKKIWVLSKEIKIE